MRRFLSVLSLVALLSCGLMAAPITFSFYSTGAFSGTAPTETGELARIVIDQYGANTVSVTTSVTNNAPAGFYVLLAGLNSVIPSSTLSWSILSGPPLDGITSIPDCCKMNGTGGFTDVELDFANSFANRVTVSRSSTLLASAAGITPLNFVAGALDSGYQAVIHAGGFDGNSVWLENGPPPEPVPEPNTLEMAGIAALLAAPLVISRRRKKLSAGTAN